jgi:uncharacterized membrane protein YhaH (DUF805 family)
MKLYIKVIKHYADFSGRARRKELWIFVLLNMIFSNAILLLENVFGITAFDYVDVTMMFNNVFGTATPDLFGSMGFGLLYLTYNLAVLPPSFAVGVRRFHDIGKSGWNYFVGLIPFVGVIILLVWFCKDSQTGENKWGANPKK